MWHYSSKSITVEFCDVDEIRIKVSIFVKLNMMNLNGLTYIAQIPIIHFQLQILAKLHSIHKKIHAPWYIEPKRDPKAAAFYSIYEQQ